MSQQVVEGVLTVKAISSGAQPGESRIVSSDDLYAKFNQYGVTSYYQSMPFAKTPALHDIYRIEFTGNHQEFYNYLKSVIGEYYSFVQQEYEEYTCYNPVDEFYNGGQLWHLNKIQADSAWEITRGSDSIDICVMEYEIFIEHPDLQGKFSPTHDIFDLDSMHTFWPEGVPIDFTHGSVVSSFAAGETTEIGDTANGRLASIGFNSEMMWTGVKDQFSRALFASTVKGAEIINVSTYATGCHDSMPSGETLEYMRLIFDEIFNNGTVVVASAGNGNIWPCFGKPPGAFNGYIDDRIIQVSGTDSTDHFGVSDGNGGTTSFSHFSAVDLCAPGYNLYGPNWMYEMVIDSLTGDTTYVERSWPYYHDYNGTSFSAPIVAGTAALIKSINPCLSPEDVQTILKSTTDTIVDANNYPGEIGTGRLNAYKAVKLAYESYSFQNYTIQSGQDVTWTEPHFIDTLYLEPTAKLTINANCFFNVLGLAIVDTAAKLTVNNATLTTTCRNMWNGIQVWGNSNLSQYPYGSNPYYYAQGRLVLNSATIENAHEAVRLWKPDNWSSTGGVVTATNTTFNNCRRSVEFISYHNFHPYSQDADDNMSKFENCEFNLDEKYFGDTQFMGHVSLYDVEGIEFTACSFYNNRDSLFIEGVLQPKPYFGYGIYSIDAGIVVNGIDNHETIDSSYFVGLEYGIKAENTESKNTIYVVNSVFNKNKTGVYTSALQGPAFIQNNFIVRVEDTAVQQEFGGLYLDNYTTGFIVEENIFSDGQGIVQPLPWDRHKISVGVVVNNSGSNNNQIYNNKFQNLLVGTLAQNRNRSRDYGSEGLSILCNEFYNLQYDIAVTADTLHDPLAVDVGIRATQGSSGNNIDDPAGNIFSLSYINPDDAWDIYTECGNKYIRYYYHYYQNGYDLYPDSVTPMLVSRTSVLTDPFTKTGACPPNYSGGGTTGSRSVLLTEVSTQNASADSVSLLLTTITDGGDTYNTNLDVMSATSNETMNVRDDLLAKSPYLTDTVMVSTIENTEALPPAIVTEILLENPHSAKSDTVLDALYARADITNSQIDQVEANEIVIGAMESLKNSHDNFIYKRDVALNKLIFTYKNDTTIVNKHDSIIAVLTNCNWPDAKYLLSMEYLDKGMYQSASDELTSIPQTFNLNTKETDEYNKFVTYFNIRKQLKQNNKNIFQLGSAQKQSLYQISGGQGRSSAWASNVLKLADTLKYNEPYILPDESLKSGEIKYRNRNDRVVEQSSLKIYPNPASEYVVIEYALEGDGKGYVINIADANGVLKQTIKPDDNRGFAVINTQNLETGTYISIVYRNGDLVGSGKFIIVN